MHDVFQLLASQEPQEIESLLSSCVGELNRPDVCSIHAPSALVILLTNFPDGWSIRTIELIKNNTALGRAIVPHLVRGYHRPVGWLDNTLPQFLAEFWEWLDSQYPANPYEKDDGGGSVTIAHDIYHFKNGVFQTLIQSGAPDACKTVENLMKRLPKAFWLGNVLAEMRKTGHRKAWIRPSPANLMQSFTATDQRLIRTAGELHKMVIEALHRFESELHGAPPSMELWNETSMSREKYWQPKDEMNLSNCLKRFLERDLKARGIIADREVQIKPLLGENSAELIDILVRAVPFGEDGNPAEPVSVVIEVKCAWNNGVMLDMERQLFERYLKNSEMHFGLYAVAYFTCSAWNWKDDARKKSGECLSAIEDLRARLSNQAASLSNPQKLVHAVVVDARLA